ncbi:e1-E2 ATPase domain-containing protein [Ditylenchus destructor]|uniref:Cation-transporting ATPase n=1 Tax=Ditylenchus destructor TaxID=166010 RepID=A0AAD4R0D3_9BILA|nr:e1-E2 ATPase domain-containing protein [Ditylenchus destructor]
MKFKQSQKVGDTDKNISSNELGKIKGHYAEIKQDNSLLSIYGFKKSKRRETLTSLISVLSLGIFRLVLYWKPIWHIHFIAKKCGLSECDFVFVRDEHRSCSICAIIEENPRKLKECYTKAKLTLPVAIGSSTAELDCFRSIIYRKIRFFWHPKYSRFVTFNDLEKEISIRDIHSHSECCKSGISSEEAQERRIFYGSNRIDVELTPILTLLFREVLNPFYIFQLLSLILWVYQHYYYFSAVIGGMSLAAIVLDVSQIRKQERKLRNMVKTADNVVLVYRDGELLEIPSEEIVPGDIIQLPTHSCALLFDAILIRGGVTINESTLTGESVPVHKTALNKSDYKDHNGFCPVRQSKHMIFCGTQMIHSTSNSQAIVLRTGFSTVKGQLIREIMFPKPVDFSFTMDLMKFICFLSVIAGLGMIYSLWVMISHDVDMQTSILSALNIVTIAVPPSLPVVLSVGIMIAQKRLRRKQIHCVSPSTINTCGAINVICFDKTGTLTEDGLDFYCLREVNKGTFTDKMPKQTTVIENEAISVKPESNLAMAMATCHNLCWFDKNLSGDPVDLTLFCQSGWNLKKENDLQLAYSQFMPSTELAIMRQYTFDSALQRMSVIVLPRMDGSAQNSLLFGKGSPEMISSLCDQSSIPCDFNQCIDEYAERGFRLIALAYRQLSPEVNIEQLTREEAEQNLTLLGVVVLANRLKNHTKEVIEELNRSNIRTLMITGDNLLTATSVGRECGIVDKSRDLFQLDLDMRAKDNFSLVVKEMASDSTQNKMSSCPLDEFDSEMGNRDSYLQQFAMTGNTFSAILEQFPPNQIDRMIANCKIFARMAPNHKQILVNRLKQMGNTVAMCGDGTNDSAALKTAHVGISLSSEAEACIAAPFTSNVKDIRCVIKVIREGRAALVTSFCLFKYLAGYSQIQFVSVLILYYVGTSFSDFQFLYIDLVLVTIVSLFFGYTHSSKKLHQRPPPTRLLSWNSIISIIAQISIAFIFQLVALLYTMQLPWFIPFKSFAQLPENQKDNGPFSLLRMSQEGTAIFLVSTFQYISLCFVNSKGQPYRKPLWTNLPLCASILIGYPAQLLHIFLSSSSWICCCEEFVSGNATAYLFYV